MIEILSLLSKTIFFVVNSTLFLFVVMFYVLIGLKSEPYQNVHAEFYPKFTLA
jgi:hypothetical protein